MTMGEVAREMITGDAAAGVAMTGVGAPATIAEDAGGVAEMVAAIVGAVAEMIRAAPAQTTAGGAAARELMACRLTLGRENKHEISTGPEHVPAGQIISSKYVGTVEVARTMLTP
jgi:hypothetical protein